MLQEHTKLISTIIIYRFFIFLLLVSANKSDERVLLITHATLCYLRSVVVIAIVVGLGLVRQGKYAIYQAGFSLIKYSWIFIFILTF